MFELDEYISDKLNYAVKAFTDNKGNTKVLLVIKGKREVVMEIKPDKFDNVNKEIN